MSAIHIAAEPGRLYLMQDGSRVRFLRWMVARTVVFQYVDESEVEHRAPLSIFESRIESVIE